LIQEAMPEVTIEETDLPEQENSEETAEESA
jgi:hypothetical protein